MSLRLSRFSVITFTAGAMSAAFAHLLELPAKMRYDKTQHVKLHRTLYWSFWPGQRIIGSAAKA